MSLFDLVPDFLFPTSRQFPFDETAESIIRALEERNWEALGIDVEFHTYGTGMQKFTYVKAIESLDFRIEFGRLQGRIPNTKYSDCAAIQEMCFGKEILTVYDDESGPTFYLYVGQNWPADRHQFYHGFKANARTDGKPRTYLRYKGVLMPKGKRPDLLVADNNLCRDYDPEGSEPTTFNLAEKMAEFNNHLKALLDRIEATPRYDYDPLSYFTKVTPIPYDTVKHPVEGIYAGCSPTRADIIERWHKDPTKVPPCDQYFYGNNECLVPPGVTGDFPEIAHECFTWCTPRADGGENQISQDIPLYFPSFSFDRLVKINLQYANDVYVIDNAPYLRAREQKFKAIAPRERLTDDEINQLLILRARTIVPITEYDGSYELPIVLIDRELNLDEVGPDMK